MHTRQVLVLLATLLAFLLPKPSPAAEEQAVLVYVSLSSAGSASKDQLTELFKLEEEIATAIQLARAGEHDGNEVGGGEFTVYCYGPSADKLYAAIEPILRSSVYAKGARVVVRYGKPGARQVEHRL